MKNWHPGALLIGAVLALLLVEAALRSSVNGGLLTVNSSVEDFAR